MSLQDKSHNDITLFLRSFYDGKKVLVTGHTGFKGSWLSIWLKNLGADVLGYSLEPPSTPSNFEASRLSDKVTSVRGDIRDFPNLLKVFGEFQPEIVFHLAAQPLVLSSYQNPRETYEVNVMGTVNVCEAVRRIASIRSFVNITSDKCYENKEWLWGYRENDALGGHDPYSSSKACAELVTQSYMKSFFCSRQNIGVATARAGNVIGGGDWGAYRLMPDCIYALSEGKEVIIRNPASIRPWQFVLEPLYGYLLLAEKLFKNPDAYMGPWNFGPASRCSVSVSTLVEKIISCWGSGRWTVHHGIDTDKEHEMSFLTLNSNKAFSLLKWHGVLGIEEAVLMTVDWYKAFYQSNAADMFDYCLRQIEEYEDKILRGRS